MTEGKPSNYPCDPYFATLQGDEFAKALRARIQSIREAPRWKQILDEQRNAYLHVFSIQMGGMSSASRVLRDGNQGELAVFRVPKARALGDAVVGLITNAKVSWECEATNADAASMAQTQLGQGVLRYYWDTAGMQKLCVDVCRGGVYFGEKFLFTEYDGAAGEPVDDPANELLLAAGGAELGGEALPEPQKTGEIRFSIVESWDKLRDPGAKSPESTPWHLFKVQRNKFDLAAVYGDEILQAKVDETQTSEGYVNSVRDAVPTELVDVWYFFHDRTPSVPKGRQVVMFGDKVLVDDDLDGSNGAPKYRKIPIKRFATGELIGTPFAKAPFWDVLAAQEVKDSVISAIATNNLTLGVQMISAPLGTDVEPTNFGGMQLLLHPPGPGNEPKPMQLTQSAPEVFKFVEMLDADQKQLLNLNDTALGQLPGAGASGALAALLASMAVQANSPLQTLYVRFVEEVGQSVLEIIQDNFDAERKIAISGQGDSSFAREAVFSGEALSKVSSVKVKVGNPLAQTVAGREAIVDKYMQLGLIKTPEDVQQLLDYGRMDGLTDVIRDQGLLVRHENEALSRGEPVIAILGDDDLYHCAHHRKVVTSLEARSNPELMNNALDHIHMHYENRYGVPAEMPPPVDPITGQPMIDPMTGMPAQPMKDPMYRERMMELFGILGPVPPMPPPGEGGGPEGGGAPPGAMPSMPTNPQTGQEFNNVDGGGAVQSPSVT